jgi:polyketide synthase PksN
MSVIDNIKKILENADEIEEINKVSKRDIAVIGLSCRFARAENAEGFWNDISNGRDCIDKFPKNRIQNNKDYLWEIKENSDYYTAGYLSDIEYFDHELFSISPKEASLMSPNQRLFLESAWHAIEDAGYGGKEIEGSNTGVFLGLSTDFGTSYRSLVETLSPGSLGMAISGNLNSTTASRISYHLDLKGPSMVVDTACSSSLAAVHYACQSLRNNECELALAGSVKVDIVPLNQQKEVELELSITAGDDRSRSFSNDASGQGLGEGVGVLLLKPLYRAVTDNDHIYAVIKGSAVNQDGRSVGLTAPNSKAQEEVIVKAWEDAQIDPMTIDCIEAHGTGTRLGDPVEIEGIQRAFRRYTNKRQFCGVGTVKTNIGHLDHAAGMAGIIKMILSLKNKEIPAMIHFNQPNKIINFTDSPVYINDLKRKWKKLSHPRRCGVSAFGLSGTNCHVILQEAPEKKESKIREHASNILTLSAKTEISLLDLAADYILFLHKNKEVAMNNLCYTANLGRKHFIHRLAIIFDTRETLLLLLNRIANMGKLEDYKDSIFYSVCKKTVEKAQEISDNPVLEAAKNYVLGREVDWRELYQPGGYHRISLPGYHFAKTRCWVEKEQNSSGLLGKCILKLYDRVVYEKEFHYRSHWVVNEHTVNGKYVMPGTAIIEMIAEAVRENFPGRLFELQEIVFLAALSMNDKEIVKVHTILVLEKDKQEFIVVSQSNSNAEWNKNVMGQISFAVDDIDKSSDISEILGKFQEYCLVKYEYEDDNEIKMSKRWDCVKEIRKWQDQYFAKLELSSQYRNPDENYLLHPSLLDEAVNLAIRSIGKDLYLPFSYKKFTYYDKMPDKFYCWVQPVHKNNEKVDAAAFDIKLLNEAGDLFVDIKHYVIKKANNLFQKKSNQPEYYKFVWKQTSVRKTSREEEKNRVLIIRRENERSKKFTDLLKSNGYKVTEAIVSREAPFTNQQSYCIDGTEKEYLKLFKDIKLKDFSEIIHLLAMDSTNGINNFNALEQNLNNGVYSLFHLVKAISQVHKKDKISLTVISSYAYQINIDEDTINPCSAAMQGMAAAISKEYATISCRFFDTDSTTGDRALLNEFENKSGESLVAFRKNKRYIREIQRVDINKYEDKSVNVRNNGVYIITGGMGSLGYECAKYLSSQEKVTIILINRTEIPPEDTWNTIIEDGSDKKLCTKIHRIRELRSKDSIVVNYTLDISNRIAAEDIFKQIRKEYKHIHGIIHCAGIAGNGLLFTKEFNNFKAVLDPKVQGTYLLDKLTKQDDLDFFVLFSSVSSFIYEEGQSDYTAANCFMDSYAYFRKKNTVSINWPAWEETGMALDYNVDMAEELFRPLKTAEAIRYLNEILKKHICNVIPGRIDFKLAVENQKMNKSLLNDEILHNVNTFMKEHIRFDKPEPFNQQIEKAVTAENDSASLREITSSLTHLWCNALGLEKIDINDSFLEVGGNSIIAIYLIKEINKKFPEMIEVSDIFSYPTIFEMAEYIFNRMNSEKEENFMPNQQEHREVREESLDVLLDKIAAGEIKEEEFDLLAKKGLL